MKSLCIAFVLLASGFQTVHAEQFVLFDDVFTFEEKDAVPAKSHLFVKADQFEDETPADWTSPVDYRHGTVHVRLEVIDKPAGNVPTVWSLCYIPNKGQGNGYGCLGSPVYKGTGVYEKSYKMTEFWENNSIIWSEGIDHVSLVLKDPTVVGNQKHAHLVADRSQFFPTTIRVTMVQVARGSTYDASKVPGLVETTDVKASRPNILVIYADDLGYGDVQCYNPKRGKVPTPHIDKLASQGMKFTDAHSSSGVCSPSRYTLLTGRYHWRTRLQRGIVGLWAAPLIAPDRMTIGTLAKQKGYRTACVGKWHLGWDWPIPADRAKLFKQRPKGKTKAKVTDDQRAVWRDVFSQVIGGGPTTRGFDEYFGTDVPNWPPYCFIENDRTVGIPSEFLNPKRIGNNQASNQGPSLPDWTLEPILPAIGDRAAKFITESATKAEPFLLYLPLTSPHTPLSVNKEWRGQSELNLYADFVMETDAVIGRVLDALETSGQANDTLVVFTSDNGCAPYIGVSHLEKKGHYPSGPLRGYKADAWEGGHRVPFVVRWPGVVTPGSSCQQLVHQADLLRTFASVLGVSLPNNAGEDSFNLVPLFKGHNNPVRTMAIGCSIRGVPGLRSGAWKYIPAPGSGGWGEGGDQSQPVQLYNLTDDPGESNNLAADLPQRVAEMKTQLESLIQQGRSTPGPKQKNDATVVRFPTKPGKGRSPTTN